MGAIESDHVMPNLRCFGLDATADLLVADEAPRDGSVDVDLALLDGGPAQQKCLPAPRREHRG